ncbi:MAG TPA: molecular chaperone HtpG [Firmicutes bacterium]|nr:molecular chaperone HtpG [Bacillota bacterium]
MPEKQGNLSINSENIFPIIKKWLYSDHDIFYRELISNGCDAITKLKKLDMMGEFETPEDTEYKILVTVNPDDKTIAFKDNGLGMTFEELDEYINQIAFSGAKDFLEKYKDKANEDQIIGHFGLGFYSAFMVADKVTIDTKSYKADAPAVHWESEGGQEFAMAEGDKTDFGTEITLYLNEDSLEFANEYKAREVITKYCSFMPVPIYLNKAGAPQEFETIDASEVTDKDVVVERTVEEAKTEERENENGEKETVEISPRRELAKIHKRPVPLNDIHPLWTKHPNDCTDEEYKKFYRTVFNDYKEPLFWIHLNMDYPFNLKGILYFPKIGSQYESIEGTIKLYNNQVFVADNIKEVIPEFLMLLKGVIDCPDLPLNVSRSALQNDGFVKKISDYITKKVADKLTGMFKVEKENYEKYWDDLSPFIKYGYIRDEKFEEKIKDCILFKNLEGKYLTLSECLEENKESHENTVFYVTDEKAQSQYINMFKEAGIDAVILDHAIDSPFISHVEQKNEGVHFLRIDTDLDSVFKEETKEEDKEAMTQMTDKLTETFRKALGNDKLEVKVEKLKNPSVASVVTLSEEGRRMQDMMKMYNMGDNLDMFGASETLVLNANHPLVTYVLDHPDGEDTSAFCEQLYDLALLSHGSLSPERMSKFVTRSNDLMMKLAK